MSVFNDLRQFKDEGQPGRRSTASSTTASIPKKPKGNVLIDPRQLRRPTPAVAERARREVRARADAGVEHADDHEGEVDDRQAADGRRPADWLQLPRPHLRDRHAGPRPGLARRHVGSVPRLPADRPRRGLRHDADLRLRRHHRPVRGEALRRQRHEVRLQGQVQARWARSTPARSAATPVTFKTTVHGPVVGYATVKGKKVAISSKRSSYGKDVARPALQPPPLQRLR